MKHVLLRLHPGLLVFCASLLLPGFVTDSLAGVKFNSPIRAANILREAKREEEDFLQRRVYWF